MGFKSEMEKLAEKMAQIVAALEEEINKLPDNPKIKRLGEKCFTMKASDLGNNWSPEYHDFKRQYREIVAGMRKRENPDTALRFLQDILGAREFRKGHQKIQLHPDVVAHVRKLLED